jgi:hypothetical protein
MYSKNVFKVTTTLLKATEGFLLNSINSWSNQQPEFTHQK